MVDTAIPQGLDPARIEAWVPERAAPGLPLYELDVPLWPRGPHLILTQDLCRVSAPPAGPSRSPPGHRDRRRGGVAGPAHVDDVLSTWRRWGRAAATRPPPAALVARLRSGRRRRARGGGRPASPSAGPGADRSALPRRTLGSRARPAAPVGSRAAGPGGRSVASTWADLPSADVVVVAPCGFGWTALAQSTPVAPRLPGVPLVAIDAAGQRGGGRTRPRRRGRGARGAFHPDAVPHRRRAASPTYRPRGRTGPAQQPCADPVGRGGQRAEPLLLRAGVRRPPSRDRRT